MTVKVLKLLKYYSATDNSKSQIVRRGDHWSPYCRLFNLNFRYKSLLQQTAKLVRPVKGDVTSLRVTEGCQCANPGFAQAFNERPYDLTL